MHTCGTSHLCKTADRVLDLLACNEHHISQLVDENDYLCHCLKVGRISCHSVVRLQVVRTELREYRVAAHHLGNSPVKSTGSLFGVDDYRDKQVRYAVKDLEFDHFRIYEYELYLLGLCVVEYTHNDRACADRLTGTGRSGDDNVRHFCDVTEDNVSGDVLADRKGQLAAGIPEFGRGEYLAESYHILVLVRHFYSDNRFSGHRRFNSYALRCEIEGNVVLKSLYLRDLYARTGLYLVTGYGRTAEDVLDADLDSEALEGVYDDLRLFAHFRSSLRTVGLYHRSCKQVERRQNVYLFLFLGLFGSSLLRSRHAIYRYIELAALVTGFTRDKRLELIVAMSSLPLGSSRLLCRSFPSRRYEVICRERYIEQEVLTALRIVNHRNAYWYNALLRKLFLFRGRRLGNRNRCRNGHRRLFLLFIAAVHQLDSLEILVEALLFLFVIEVVVLLEAVREFSSDSHTVKALCTLGQEIERSCEKSQELDESESREQHTKDEKHYYRDYFRTDTSEGTDK